MKLNIKPLHFLLILIFISCIDEKPKMNNLFKLDIKDWTVLATGNKIAINDDIFITCAHPEENDWKLLHLNIDGGRLETKEVLKSKVFDFSYSNNALFIENGFPNSKSVTDNIYCYDLKNKELKEKRNHKLFFTSPNLEILEIESTAILTTGEKSIKLDTSLLKLMSGRARVSFIKDSTLISYNSLENKLTEVVYSLNTNKAEKEYYTFPTNLTIKDVVEVEGHIYLVTYSHQVYKFDTSTKAFSQIINRKIEEDKGFVYSEISGKYFLLSENYGESTNISVFELTSGKQALSENVEHAKLSKDKSLVIITKTENKLLEYHLENKELKEFNISLPDKITKIHVSSDKLILFETEKSDLYILLTRQ